MIVGRKGSPREDYYDISPKISDLITRIFESTANKPDVEYSEIDLIVGLSACPGGDCSSEHSSDEAAWVSGTDLIIDGAMMARL